MEEIDLNKNNDLSNTQDDSGNIEQTEKIVESENALEQPKSELTTDSREVSKILNRFACVEDLENAYKSLRAEFTKKSQRLSELEQEVKEGKTSASVVETLVDNPVPVVQTQESDNSLKTLKGAASDEIIKNYLLSVAALKRQAPAVIANCAVDFASSQQNVKKSMSDTTKEVENFFIRRKL